MRSNKLPDPEILSPEEVTLSRTDDGHITLIFHGDEHKCVRINNPLPFESSLQYVCFCDSKGKKEIAMMRVDDSLNPETRSLIDEELSTRYLGAIIQRIIRIDLEGHTSYWEVETDRGVREFALNNLNQNIQRPGPGFIVITDVHENRFIIRDVNALDGSSLKHLDTLL